MRDPRAPQHLLTWVLLLFCVPVAGPMMMMGYSAEVHQRLAASHPNPLPRFAVRDASHYLSRGSAAFAGGMVYSLPNVCLLLAGATLWLNMLGSWDFGPSAVALDALRGVGKAPAGSHYSRLGLMTAGLLLLAVLATLPVLASRLLADRTADLTVALSPRRVAHVIRVAGLRLMLAYAAFSAIAALLLAVGTLLLCVGSLFVAAGLYIASVHLRWQIANASPSLPRAGQPAPLPSEQTDQALKKV